MQVKRFAELSLVHTGDYSRRKRVAGNENGDTEIIVASVDEAVAGSGDSSRRLFRRLYIVFRRKRRHSVPKYPLATALLVQVQRP